MTAGTLACARKVLSAVRTVAKTTGRVIVDACGALVHTLSTQLRRDCGRSWHLLSNEALQAQASPGRLLLGGQSGKACKARGPPSRAPFGIQGNGSSLHARPRPVAGQVTAVPSNMSLDILRVRFAFSSALLQSK